MLGVHFLFAKNFIFDVQYTYFRKIMGYFLLSKLQKSNVLQKPKFSVLMIHALMLKLHFMYKVGRVGP